MSNTDDDKDLMLLVAAGTTLVATGTALSSVRPMVGVALILVAVAFLLFSLVCSVQRQKGRRGVHKHTKTGVWLVAVLVGMMLSGGGAALSVVQFPMLGLGIAVGGGVLCGISAWRLVVAQF